MYQVKANACMPLAVLKDRHVIVDIATNARG